MNALEGAPRSPARESARLRAWRRLLHDLAGNVAAAFAGLEQAASSAPAGAAVA